jgi:hypothetical protein
MARPFAGSRRRAMPRATRARRWPRTANCSSLDGRIVTMANSEATKQALTKTSAMLASMATA